MACFVRARDFIVGAREFFAAGFLLRFIVLTSHLHARKAF
jgi:hypothetical protein